MIVRLKKLPVSLYGTLLDVETNGLLHEPAEVITLGVVSGDRLKIIQRTNEKDFPTQAFKIVKKLPRPFYAFNKGFEEKMLGITIERELQAQEYEKKREAIKIAGLHDPFDGQGFHAINAWNRYISTNNKNHLLQIMDHNEACLLLETCLALVRWKRSLKGHRHDRRTI